MTCGVEKSAEFEPDDGSDEGGDEQQSPEGGRFMEDKDADEHGAHRADSGPHGIGSADGERASGSCQQDHAGDREGQETTYP